MLQLYGLRAITVIICFAAVLNCSTALVKRSSRHSEQQPRLSDRLFSWHRPRNLRSLSDENTCYILGLHATCTGTTSNHQTDQRTFAELLSSFRLSPNIQYLTISQNVNLSSRNLHVLERLSELNISNNAAAAATLDENFLAHFPRLTTLKIVKSGLTTLPVFRDRHPSLTTLVLNHNAIQSWTEASLLALPNLRSLHLARNNITELRAEMFPRDCQLTELLVQKNRISRIDPLVGTARLRQLRQFRLSRNRLHVSLNQSVSQSRKSRPDIFPHFPSVELLDLSQNGLEFIPPLMFREWRNLKDLRLSKNRLQFFGAGSFFIEGGGLHSLDLGNNRVASVNREIAYGLDELQTLHLSQNDIRTVQTDAFEVLKKLQNLYLDHNKLSFIGGIFDPLSRLEVLRLSSNPNLAQLPSNAFGGLHRLKELDLSNNSIHVIDDKVFESLNQLRHLSLAQNRLTMIRGGYFSGLVRLEELDLRGNNITGVEDSESNDLKGMIFLRKLHLQTSHYHCGLCSLRAFVSWLRSKGFAEPEVSVHCASPPALRGLSVLTLRESQAADCEIGLVPKVISHPPSEAKLVGQNLNLDCTILSNLAPRVTWQRAPLTLDAVAKSSKSPNSASGATVGVGMVASGSRRGAGASGADAAALLRRPVYANLALSPDQVSLIRSDKEWRAQLRLTQLNTTDSGLYRCSVTVSQPSSSSSPAAAAAATHHAPIYSLPATIRVLAPPRFVQRPEPLYKAREGESLEIPCASVGFPKPEQSLRRLGNFPAAVERRLTLPEGDAARFGIRRLSGVDTGDYICISENAGGRVETTFTLEVLTRPRFVSDSAWSARVGVRPGGDLVLDCEAEANPAPAYAWYFNDKRLNNRTEAQLRLASAVLADAGVYQCEAANSVGLVSRRVQLFVGSRPIVHPDISTTAGPPPVSTADGVDGVSIVSTDNSDSRPNFSLLVFAVVVSATSCVLLTTLLWCVVFVFLRRKSRRMKRSLSQRLEDQARAHREQMYRSEPALSGLSRQPSLLQQQPQPQQQQQQQQPPQQQRMPLMVSSMMALPHSKSGDLLLLAGGLPAASGPAPPIPPFHLPQQQQPQLQMPADQLNLRQHKQQRLSRYANGNGNSAHRSEPDLIVNGGSMVAIGNGNSRFPLLQQQRSCQPIQLSQFAQQQQQKQQQQKQQQQQQQPPTETSDYNTGSASSGDSVEHLRCHGYDSHGYCLNSHQRLQQLQEQQLMMQQQQQQHSQQPLLTSWRSGRHAQRVLLQQQLSYQYQQQQQQQQQTPVCSTFTGQKSPSSTEFDSGCEPSGSSLARPRSSRSLLLTSGGGGPSVVTVQETVT